MGVQLGNILPRSPVKLENLKYKKIAIDTYIHLYQFLNTLPRLTDKKGRITTHLVGLFHRTTALMELKIKPAFVFDGPFPEIKKHKRIQIESPQPRTSSALSLEMIKDAKRLLRLLGCPVVQAPSEGEAQAAHMCRKGHVWAVASQDFDSLVYGAPRMLKNLTFAKTRKLPRKGYVLIGTYLYELKNCLKKLGIDEQQFIALAMLVGTDFNPGVYGIGQKKGLELVKKHKKLDDLFARAGWVYGYSWREIWDCITTLPVTNKYKLKWKKPDKEGVIDFLVKERDFNEKRVKNALEKI